MSIFTIKLVIFSYFWKNIKKIKWSPKFLKGLKWEGGGGKLVWGFVTSTFTPNMSDYLWYLFSRRRIVVLSFWFTSDGNRRTTRLNRRSVSVYTKGIFEWYMYVCNPEKSLCSMWNMSEIRKIVLSLSVWHQIFWVNDWSVESELHVT